MGAEVTPSGEVYDPDNLEKLGYWPEHSRMGHSRYTSYQIQKTSDLMIAMPVTLSLVGTFSAIDEKKSSSHTARLPEPSLRIEHEGASCWSLDWANSDVVAVGLTNGKTSRIKMSAARTDVFQGCVAVYNIQDALEKNETPSESPRFYFRSLPYTVQTSSPHTSL